MSRGATHRLRCIATVFALFHLLLAVGKSDATLVEDESTLARLMKEAPKKWAEYENIAKQFQGTETGEIEIEKTLHTWGIELKHNNDCELIRFSGQHLESVTAFNPLYSFEVTRKDKSSPWVLRQVKFQRGKDKPVMDHEFESSAVARSILVAPCHYRLSKLFRQPTFEVRDVRLVTRDHEELVEVSFLNTHDIRDNMTEPFCPIQGGTLVLDPNRYWCVRSGELVLQYSPGNARAKLEISLRDSEAGYPVPISYVETWTPMGATATGLLQRKIRRQFDFQVPTRLPDTADFTLSALGLPEPPGVTWPKPTPWYLWVTGIGLGLVLVGAAVRILRRRYASRLSAG